MYRRLSDSIPNDVVDKIYIIGKEQPEQKVYRLCKSGIIDEGTFLNTYDEYNLEKRVLPETSDVFTIYSTSCSLKEKRIQRILKCIKKSYFLQYPTPCVIVGHTIGGISQRTIDRIPNYKDKDHIDWWIFQDCISQIVSSFVKVECLSNEKEGVTNE